MAGSDVESTVESRFSMNRPQATINGMSFRAGIKSGLSQRVAEGGASAMASNLPHLKGHTTKAAVSPYMVSLPPPRESHRDAFTSR